MLNQLSRTQLLFGPEAMERLSQCRVAVFGIGGVGGYAVEALVRSGIGTLDLIDDDRVCLTNLNRQLHATRKTVGQYKVDVAEERVHEINPDCIVTTYKTFLMPETQAQFDFSQYDYIVDAIDTVKGKLALVEQAQASGTPIICAMGAGNKLDPTAFRVADIFNLAAVLNRIKIFAGVVFRNFGFLNSILCFFIIYIFRKTGIRDRVGVVLVISDGKIIFTVIILRCGSVQQEGDIPLEVFRARTAAILVAVISPDLGDSD